MGRSQRHKVFYQGVASDGSSKAQGVTAGQGGAANPPPLNQAAITGILPDTASIAAAGAVNRTVATLSTQGGTSPFTYAVQAAGGLNLNISGNLLRTNADPVGTAGAKTVGITSTDKYGKTKTENIAVTVT